MKKIKIVITPEEKAKIEKHLNTMKNKKYLHENRDAREMRKAREYVQKCNIKSDKTIWNGVKNKNTKRIYSIRKPRQYEKCETEKQKYDEVCVLYENGKIAVVYAEITKMKIKPIDGIMQEKIMMYLPKYQMRFEVKKMKKLAELAEKITHEKEIYTQDEIARIMLKTGKSVYIVKGGNM